MASGNRRLAPHRPHTNAASPRQPFATRTGFGAGCRRSSSGKAAQTSQTMTATSILRSQVHGFPTNSVPRKGQPPTASLSGIPGFVTPPKPRLCCEIATSTSAAVPQLMQNADFDEITHRPFATQKSFVPPGIARNRPNTSETHNNCGGRVPDPLFMASTSEPVKRAFMTWLR